MIRADANPILGAGMFAVMARWWERRRTLQRLCREDARLLLERNPSAAYYDAQRLAARARFAGDSRAFMHWARVAAEVARISNNPMDIKVVQAIADEEEQFAKHGSTPSKSA
jgi:hypothetical protein